MPEEDVMAQRQQLPTHPYVECRQGVCGGRPVLKGTRFPVSSVVIYYQQGLTAEEILKEFPQLSPPQVYGALAYYFEHQAEITAEIEKIQLIEK
jgi:uncharacterized protein (DUF433 family)